MRGVYLLVVGILIGVLITLLPMPGLIHTIGYAAAAVLVIVGLVLLVLDLIRGGARHP